MKSALDVAKVMKNTQTLLVLSAVKAFQRAENDIFRQTKDK